MNELIKELVAQSGFGVRQNEVYTSKLEHLHAINMEILKRNKDKNRTHTHTHTGYQSFI